MTDIPQKSAGGFSLPVLGLGTWEIGGRYEADNSRDKEGLEAITSAIKLGITHIDTAEAYGNGHAEELVGQAIKGFHRQSLFITTKVSWEHLRHDQVIAACKGSLQRLGIEQIDLYLVHGPDENVPLAETMKAMDKMVDEGLVKNIGVSNFDSALIEEAQSYAAHKIVNNQIHYSLYARAYEDNGTLEYCRKNNILISAYRPWGVGKSFGMPEGALPVLENLGKKYQKTAVQVALNWAINQDGVVALIKSSNPDHLKENLGALGWQLDAEDMEELNKNFARGETMNVATKPTVRK